MKQKVRLHSAAAWIARGARPTIGDYRRRYGLSRLGAATDLCMLGQVAAEVVERERHREQARGEQRRRLREKREAARRAEEAARLPEWYWTEGGQAPEYSIGFIAGFTSGGAPYGLTYEQIEELEAAGRWST